MSYYTDAQCNKGWEEINQRTYKHMQTTHRHRQWTGGRGGVGGGWRRARGGSGDISNTLNKKNRKKKKNSNKKGSPHFFPSGLFLHINMN